MLVAGEISPCMPESMFSGCSMAGPIALIGAMAAGIIWPSWPRPPIEAPAGALMPVEPRAGRRPRVLRSVLAPSETRWRSSSAMRRATSGLEDAGASRSRLAR
ncbi:Uncharacterised protein [Mycobacteroides abscessus subsp. massiliense]|nr:Uncharacterised protein [Mycobacteroides abscessus subsp. massiliense]